MCWGWGWVGRVVGVMGWAKNVLLDFYMCVMLRCCTLPWTSTHTSCVLLDFYMHAMLRCCTFSWTSACTSCYAAGWFKKSTSKAVTVHKHKDCRQNFPNFWWYLYAAVWRKSVTGKLFHKLGELSAWRQDETFARSSQDTKIQFCCGKTLHFAILRWPFHRKSAKELLQKNENAQITQFWAFQHIKLSCDWLMSWPTQHLTDVDTMFYIN